MVTFNILLVVVLLITFLLVLVIMVQQPKGGGLSSSFGGNAQVIGGVKKTGDFLDRSTWVLGSSLIIVILMANIVLKNNKGEVNGGSVYDGVKPVQTSVPVQTPQGK